MTRILIVEDEAKIAQVLTEYFQREGFECTHLDKGTGAAEEILSGVYDCVILDVMLPGVDGLEICKSVRRSSDVPIIMLTARVDEIDRLLGLELGADDYVCKPFSPREVVARVRTILRRVRHVPTNQPEDDALTYGSISLHPERHLVAVLSTSVDLTPVEFRMLERMLRHPGRVYSRADLMDGAYDDHRVVSDRTIDSHIKNLRRKLTDAGASDAQIHSIYGVGYKLE